MRGWAGRCAADGGLLKSWCGNRIGFFAGRRFCGERRRKKCARKCAGYCGKSADFLERMPGKCTENCGNGGRMPGKGERNRRERQI